MVMQLSASQSLESLSSEQLASQCDVTAMSTNVYNLMIKAPGEHLEHCWLKHAIVMSSRCLLYKF